MKTVLVVCDHGTSSMLYASGMQRSADGKTPGQFTFLARGIMARQPSTAEMEAAVAILAPYAKSDLARMPGMGLPADYMESWRKFLEEMESRGKPVFAYNDYVKREPVFPPEMIEKILRLEKIDGSTK